MNYLISQHGLGFVAYQMGIPERLFLRHASIEAQEGYKEARRGAISELSFAFCLGAEKRATRARSAAFCQDWLVKHGLEPPVSL